jgi:HD-like signal output (HDOD) protein
VNGDKLVERLAEPGALPALPAALVSLQSGLYDLNIDVDQLCRGLECDPALVSEILKTINSPLFGVPKKIESVKNAVMLLGLRRVRAIVLSQSLRKSLATYNSPGFDAFHWWDRSILMAVTATSLCKRVSPGAAEEAYLAGLMAELGVLVLARFEPEYEALLRQYAHAACRDLHRAEGQELGVDHALLAADIFRLWEMPDEVVQAAENHHNPQVLELEEASILCKSVYFAALLADAFISPGDELCAELASVGETLGLDPQDLGEFAGECLESYRHSAGEMGFTPVVEGEIPEALARCA